jgi:hypothetical protein
MPAQSGTAITLGYGPQGSRQLGGSIVLEYQVVATPRVRVTSAVRSPWAASKPGQQALSLKTPPTARLESARRTPWGIGSPVSSNHQAPWTIGRPVDRARRAPWRYFGRALQPEQHVPWGKSRASDRERYAPWGAFPHAPLVEQNTRWPASRAADRERYAPWGRFVTLRGTDVHSVIPASRGAGIVQWVPWLRYSRPLSPGWGVVSPPGPTPNPDGTYVVPSLQVYIVLNTLTLVRVDTGQALPALDVSLSLDTDSWTWTFRATMPASTLASVQPTAGVPVVLQATINGVPYRAMVEGIRRDRTFGRDRIAVTGRGLAAELGDPYSPTLTFANTSARTAQQLLGDVLTENSVPMDWTVDWQLTDWLVPAGAWSVQGSRMDAITAIAAAAGGFVLPDPVAKVLRIKHRYPVAPWDWLTTAPAFELPAAVVQSEGTEWVTRPTYNRVFVSGQRDGVLAQVTRDGTAGDLIAPMVTDPLITHVDAGRQRGLAILANVGRQAIQTLRLPVLDETGVIEPGTLIRYVDGTTTRRGIVRATQVDARWSEAWQSLSVETHDA